MNLIAFDHVLIKQIQDILGFMIYDFNNSFTQISIANLKPFNSGKFLKMPMFVSVSLNELVSTVNINISIHV